MSMTFDEYIEKRVHQVSVDFANNLWYHGVHDLEKIADSLDSRRWKGVQFCV